MKLPLNKGPLPKTTLDLILGSSYPLTVSAFLVHQESSYLVLLADSLGTKTHAAGGAPYPVTAPKLVHVAPGVYAAHAGTLQPAIDMLSELGKTLEQATTWDAVTAHMKGIGETVYARYQERFKTDSFDVRVVLVLTGERRHPSDSGHDRSSSIVLWEVARKFEPHHVTGDVYVAGSVPLSELITNFLKQPLLAGMLQQGPLAAAHALVAAHAALSKLSSTISPDANVVIIGEDCEHTVLQGTLLDLAQAALIKG